MQCELTYTLANGTQRRCPRTASHVHLGMMRAYLCSIHSFAEDKPIHATPDHVSGSAQKDAIRVIEKSSKPNQSYAPGAVRPTVVWFKVLRFNAHGAVRPTFVVAKFRLESDANDYADLLRARGTDYHYSVKAGR